MLQLKKIFAFWVGFCHFVARLVLPQRCFVVVGAWSCPPWYLLFCRTVAYFVLFMYQKRILKRESDLGIRGIQIWVEFWIPSSPPLFSIGSLPLNVVADCFQNEFCGSLAPGYSFDTCNCAQLVQPSFRFSCTPYQTGLDAGRFRPRLEFRLHLLGFFFQM